MKTHEIKDLLKKDLLILELPRKADVEIFPNSIEIYNQFTGQEETIKGSYTLLGKPDEIKEEDAAELVEFRRKQIAVGLDDLLMPNQFYYETAKESLLSLLESEIYWDMNPFGEKPVFDYDFPEDGPSESMYESAVDDFDMSSIKWHEAQSRTFNRNRSIIFVKN